MGKRIKEVPLASSIDVNTKIPCDAGTDTATTLSVGMLTAAIRQALLPSLYAMTFHSAIIIVKGEGLSAESLLYIDYAERDKFCVSINADGNMALLTASYMEPLTTLQNIFKNNKRITSVDLSLCDMSLVTSLKSAFNGCTSLQTVNMAGVTTPLLTDCAYMFNGCTSLTSVTMDSINTSQVANYSYMFNNCQQLLSLNLRSLVVNSTSTISGIFNGTTAIGQVIYSAHNAARLKDSAFNADASGVGTDITFIDIDS